MKPYDWSVVEEDPIPDRPRWPLATWTVLVAIVAFGIVAFLIANRAAPSEASSPVVPAAGSALRGAPSVSEAPGGAPYPVTLLSGSGTDSTPHGELTVSVGGVRQGRTGTVTHMGAGYPANYLALPIGPGHRVKVCGPRTCLVLTSTDAGPNRKMLQAGRIADVSVQLFAKLCCDPSRGTFQGSWKLLGPAIRLPDTSTEGSAP